MKAMGHVGVARQRRMNVAESRMPEEHSGEQQVHDDLR